MSISLEENRQKGMAILELILILVALGAVIGIGAWVYKQRKSTTTNNSTTTSNTSSAPTASAGTTESIDQLTQQDGSSEAAIDSKHETSEQNSVQSTNTSLNNLGGAYNESSF